MLVCQGCGKDLLPHDEAVLVSYGYIAKSGRFYCRKGTDYFHKDCDKSFRS